MTDKLRIYDISLDEMRDATQADIDALVLARQCLGCLLEALWDRNLLPAEKVGRMVTIHGRFREDMLLINKDRNE